MLHPEILYCLLIAGFLQWQTSTAFTVSNLGKKLLLFDLFLRIVVIRFSFKLSCMTINKNSILKEPADYN